MKTSRHALVGSCAGVLAGLALAHFLSAPPPPPPLPRTEAAPETPPVALELETPRAPSGAGAPGASARESALAPAALPLSLMEALTRAGPPGSAQAERLPSLQRCLLDRELNPAQLACPDPARQRELEQFIAHENRELARLEAQHTGLVDSLIAAKLEARLDPPESWAAIPDSERLLQCQVTIGADQRLGTVLRRGESPEIEGLAEEIEARRSAAREELRRRIAELAPR